MKLTQAFVRGLMKTAAPAPAPRPVVTLPTPILPMTEGYFQGPGKAIISAGKRLGVSALIAGVALPYIAARSLDKATQGTGNVVNALDDQRRYA